MSPTVLHERGYRVVIYLNDHVPAHVHVRKGNADARVRLEPVELLHNYGFKPCEISDILGLVADNQNDLLAKWDTMHPSRE